MSNISDRHQFATLTKDSKPLAGQRLVRLIAKGENKSPNLMQSLCVSVPHVTQEAVVECIDRLLPHVVGMVKDAQDKIIREYRIQTGADTVGDHHISMDQVIEWLDANAAGDRVTTEYLQEWFKEGYEQLAHQYIAHILKVDGPNAAGEYPEIVVQKGNMLRELFSGWASPKYSPNIPKLKAMIAFGQSVPNDGRMSGILVRAADMLAKKEAELESDALGF